MRSDVVDYDAPTSNMYGCQPCSECGSKYRCVFQKTNYRIDCDDCGHLEVIFVGKVSPEKT